jgi:hypothetical protein
MSGKSYITFDSLNIQGGNSYLIAGNGASNIVIKNSVIFGAGIYAIWGNASQTNWTVINDSISYANSIGIRSSQNAGNKKWTITNNYINQVGNVAGMGGSGEGEYFSIRDMPDSSTISGNTVKNSGYVPINFKGVGILVQNNFVDSFCSVKDDGGGIYFGGFNFSGSRVTGNIVTNGIGAINGTPDVGDPRAYGIYADDGTSNVEVDSNSSATSGGAGIYCHNCHDINFHHNTLWDNGVTAIKYFNDGNTIANVTYKHNINFSKTSGELVYRSSGGADNPKDSFWCSGCLDSNYYNRPISESNHFVTIVPSGTYSLSTWKTYVSPLDSHSNGSPKSVSSTDSLRFDYNATSSPVTINIGAKWEDVTGTLYNGSITLQPYTSSVLIFVGNLTNQKGMFFKHY